MCYLLLLCVSARFRTSRSDYTRRVFTFIRSHSLTVHVCAPYFSSFVSYIRLQHSSPRSPHLTLKGTEAAEHVKNNARSKRLAKKSGKLTQDEAQAKATKAKKASAFRNKVRERDR